MQKKYIEGLLWQIGAVLIAKNFTSRTELRAIIQRLQKVKKPLQGIVIQELELIEVAWDSMRKRALFLGSEKAPFVLGQLIHSIENWKLLPIEKRPIAAIRDSYKQLTLELNNELLIKMTERLSVDLQHALEAVAVDATDEYTLAAYLTDFRTELTSMLLKSRLEELKKVKQELLEDETNQFLFQREKELAKLRQELSDNIASLAVILHGILHAILPIEKQHPELNPLKELCELFLFAIEADSRQLAWGHKLILWYMLTTRMDFALVTLSKDGATTWAAALLNSVYTFTQQEGKEPLMDALRTPEKPLPEKLKVLIKTWLIRLHALPEPPYPAEANPYLLSLIL